MHHYAQLIKMSQYNILPVDKMLTENYTERGEMEIVYLLYIHHTTIINDFPNA